MNKLTKSLIAECVGTFLLVVICCGSAVVNGANVIITASTFGIVLFLLAVIIGPVSGCHVNPAVTVAMIIKKKIKPIDGLAYIGIQFVGAVLGALTLFAVFKLTQISDLTTYGSNGVASALATNSTNAIILAFIVEVLLTFVFVSAILATLSKKVSPLSGAAIAGIALMVVHLFGIGITGTSVNPARSFGPALVSLFNDFQDPIKDYWVFLIAPLLGGALAGAVNLFTRPEEE